MTFKKETFYLAIDIGSNAMRAALAVRDLHNDLEIIDNFRFPLRLGEDVFQKGKVSSKKIQSMDEAFKNLSDIIKEYNISHVKAVATSALRDASNGKEVCQIINEKYKIKIKIISGLEEAKLVQDAIESNLDLKNKKALFIDIGGGSTEIVVLNDKKSLYRKSFQCGTLRLLQENDESKIKKLTEEMTSELRKDFKGLGIGKGFDLCVGTGGNLRRMGKLRKVFFRRSYLKVSQFELSAISAEVKKFSLQQRISFLNMRKDRADVIVPAMYIVEDILIKLDISEIHLPQVGLKEGLLIEMLEKKPRYIFFK